MSAFLVDTFRDKAVPLVFASAYRGYMSVAWVEKILLLDTLSLVELTMA